MRTKTKRLAIGLASAIPTAGIATLLGAVPASAATGIPQITGGQSSSSPGVAVRPLDEAFGHCDPLPDGYCEATWVVSTGSWSAEYCSFNTVSGDLFCNPPLTGDCKSSTCQYSYTGQGTGWTPDGWYVSGNNATIISTDTY